MTANKRPSSIWRLAWGPLVLSAVMLAAAAALVAVGVWWAGTAQRGVQASMQRLSAAQEALRTSQDARAKLEQNLVQFVELKKGNFVGVPDRLALLEALERAAALWPKGRLQWEIGAEQTVRKLTDQTTSEAVADIRVIPMKLSAVNVHEVEWFDFLSRLREQKVGYFRVEACDLRKTSFVFRLAPVFAVNASCNLSWVYVVPENAAVLTK